jgi:hypothetical protein
MDINKQRQPSPSNNVLQFHQTGRPVDWLIYYYRDIQCHRAKGSV